MSNFEKNPFENAIGDIIEAAKETNAREDGDYIGEDGLLYCGKCHTPKEAFFCKRSCAAGKEHPSHRVRLPQG